MGVGMELEGVLVRVQEVGGRRKLVLMLYGIERSCQVSDSLPAIFLSYKDGDPKDMKLIKSNDPTPSPIINDIPIPIPPSPPPLPPTFLIGTICSNQSIGRRIGEIKDTSSEEG
jgi:hypothetical protein